LLVEGHAPEAVSKLVGNVLSLPYHVSLRGNNGAWPSTKKNQEIHSQRENYSSLQNLKSFLIINKAEIK